MPRLANGPLRVLPANPIYFTADGVSPVCLSGAHTWANLQDFGGASPDFRFVDYLDMLTRDHHNVIRLWTWPGAITQAQSTLFPHPWERAGGGRFNVRLFDEEFWNRLRSRVQQAADRGMYVIVMLFQQLSSTQGLRFLPSIAANNINGLDDPLISADGVVTGFQQDYAKRFVDELNSFDNILWEVGNEILEPYLPWQADVVKALRRYEQTKPKQHLIGVNTGFGRDGATMEQLKQSKADYIALISGQTVYVPPPSHWGLPVFADTDHLRQPLNTSSDQVRIDWAWFSFVRGYHPIDMQAIQVRLPGYSDPWNNLNNGSLRVSREAMGAVRKVASFSPLERMRPLGAVGDGLLDPLPSDDLAHPLQSADAEGIRSSSEGLDDAAAAASTSRYFLLADPTPEDPFYVGYSQGTNIGLDLSRVAGTLWWRTLNPRNAATTSGPTAVDGGKRHVFQRPPGAGRWVLVLSRHQDPTWRTPS